MQEALRESRSVRNPTPSRTRETAVQAATAFGLAAAGILVSRESWSEMISTALKDPDAAHVLVAPAVIAGMFWIRRGRLRLCTPRNLWIGPAILGAGAALLVLGERYWIQSFRHAAAVAILAGAILSVYGSELLRNFLPAFAALAFLVPVPGAIRQRVAVPLQTDLAGITAEIIGVLGLSASRSGNVLQVNGAQLSLAQGSTGLREFFLLVLLVYAFVFASPFRNRTRAVLIALSPICVLLANLVRLVPLVLWVASNPSSDASRLVELSGWIALVLAMGFFAAIFQALKRAPVPMYRYGLAYDR